MNMNPSAMLYVLPGPVEWAGHIGKYIIYIIYICIHLDHLADRKDKDVFNWFHRFNEHLHTAILVWTDN